MHIGCITVVKCDTCKVFGAYAQLDCITTSILGDVGNIRQTMQGIRIFAGQTYISIISFPTEN